jgi:hypothetical protein
MMVWVIAYYFSRPDWTSFVSANLAILTPLLADSCKEGATTAAREASIAACFARNSGGVAALACAVLAVLLAAGSAAAVLVHITTFPALSLTVLTWGTGTAGVLLAAAGAYLLAVVGGSGFATLTGCMLGAGHTAGGRSQIGAVVRRTHGVSPRNALEIKTPHRSAPHCKPDHPLHAVARNTLRYCMASATWLSCVLLLPARSAMVLAIFKVRWVPRADQPS